MGRQPRRRRCLISLAIGALAIVLVLAPSEAYASTASHAYLSPIPGAYPSTIRDAGILLQVGLVIVSLSLDDGLMCVDDWEGLWLLPVVEGGTLVGPVSLLAPYTGSPDGRRLVIKAGTRRILLHVNSSTALVDGRAVDLGGPLTVDTVPRAPLERLAPLLGYRLLFGRTPPSVFYGNVWVMRLPRGARIPWAIDLAKHALFDGTAAVLLLDSPLVKPDDWFWDRCGTPARSSGALVPYPPHGGEPWGDLRRVAAELGWSVTWDARRRTGSVRAGSRRVAVDVTSRPSTRVLIDGQAYPAPPPFAAKVEAGRLIVPVVAVATKLGWRARYPTYVPRNIVRLSR